MTRDRRNDAARRDAGAIALLLGVVVVFFADLFFFGQTLFTRDLSRYHYPMKRVVREIILDGGFPSWNPYFQGGQPLAASPAWEVFYPPQWLTLLPGYTFWFNFHIVLHVAIALAGMYFFLRALSVTRFTAIAGALSFGLAGFFLSLVDLLPTFFPLAWMPVVLLGAHRFFLQPSARRFALASLALAMPLLVGEPTTIVQTALLAWLLALHHARAGEAGGRIGAAVRNTFTVAAIGAGGVAVAAVQFIPAIDLALDSVRRFPIPWVGAIDWSLPAPRLAELLLPEIFGRAAAEPGRYYGRVFYEHRTAPYVQSLYAGMLVFVMAVAALFVRVRGRLIVLAAVTASFLLALGGSSPLFRLLYDVGLFRSIRYPERFVISGLFALIVVGLLVFDRVVRGDRAAIRIAFRVTLAVTAALAAAAAAASFFPLEVLFAHAQIGAAELEAAAAAARVALLLALARAGLLLLLLAARDRVRERLWRPALLLFVVVDVGFVSSHYVLRTDASYFDQPAVAAGLDPDRSDYRIFHQADWEFDTQTSRAYFSLGFETYWVNRNGMFPLLPAAWDFRTVLHPDYDMTLLLPTAYLHAAMVEVREAGNEEWARIFMAMTNARYYTRFRPFPAEIRRIDSIEQIRPVDFIRHADHPRYYFADRVVAVRNLDEFIKLLSSREWSGREAFAPVPAFTPAAARLLAVVERPDRIRVEVEAAGDAFLVASVTRHDYWKATVDGRPAQIIPTNVAFQGIVVPAGRHTVELRYFNPVVAVSGLVSIVALALAGFAITAPRAIAAATRNEENGRPVSAL